MHYAIEVVPFYEYADPRKIVTLAQAAEVAGWEGLFLWDHLGFVRGFPSSDPWITLAAVGASTNTLKLGLEITPIPRHRPHTLMHYLVSLDLLSQGRVIFGAGLGFVPEEWSRFGENPDIKRRAAMLDEGLDLLNQLMSGEHVNFHGDYYTVDNLTFTPLPVQTPRIPFWIGGDSRPALRRAARWDGWVTTGTEENRMIKTPQEMADQVVVIHQHRTSSQPFDIAITGCTAPEERALVNEFASAGATWWLECLSSERGSMKEMLKRIDAGPPK